MIQCFLFNLWEICQNDTFCESEVTFIFLENMNHMTVIVFPFIIRKPKTQNIELMFDTPTLNLRISQ